MPASKADRGTTERYHCPICYGDFGGIQTLREKPNRPSDQKMRFAILVLITVSACSLLRSSPPGAIELETLVASPLEFREQVVTTCGWATNQFENVKITTERRGFNRGFGMRWLPTEQETTRSQWKCVTGKIVPSCGWDTYGDPSIICVSTGHGFEFVLQQTTAGMD